MTDVEMLREIVDRGWMLMIDRSGPDGGYEVTAGNDTDETGVRYPKQPVTAISSTLEDAIRTVFSVISEMEPTPHRFAENPDRPPETRAAARARMSVVRSQRDQA